MTRDQKIDALADRLLARLQKFIPAWALPLARLEMRILIKELADGIADLNRRDTEDAEK